ncbi:transcriptional regulator swi6 [Friedmanniomyces endolithicus]|nr:transcriptional regulator swi6 [Friedmanniomyces endolithicus]
MATIAAIAPTPQQSFAHMQPAVSPQGPSAQPTGMPGYYGHNYNMSFDSQHGPLPYPPPNQHPHPHPHPHQHQPQNGQPVYAQSFANGPVSNPGYARSFGEGYGPVRGYMEKAQIYTAVYSGVSVYEMDIQGVACMRRRSDGWLNATQILKVAGVDKGKRTKVLEKEILTGEHEKVQGGYGKYQGTWISYRRGREFCRQYGVEDILRPLLDYDVSADGSGGQGQDTPTKEQAMAANRKRFYQPSVDGGRPQGPMSNGTFFQNISPTTSVALAAMNKAARLNSPAPQRPTNMRHPSQQDGMVPGSQQSMASQASFNGDDSGYSTQPNGGEPPRKRMRHDSQDGMAPPVIPWDASMRSATPTEPNESFMYEGAAAAQERSGNSEPTPLPPLPAPSTEDQMEKHGLIMDLFAEPGRTDYSTHDALTKLSAEDLNLPLDVSANTALHWAATLAKVSLLKLLMQKGADIWRGNAAGHSPLISAVLVGNCWEKSCFPELLELLHPLIEVRDAQGRTILHHIAVSSGINARRPSSKYYLEALLEYLVRVGTQPTSSTHVSSSTVAPKARVNGDSSSQDSVASASAGVKGAVSLSRFLAHIVNAKDIAGNTALNLVARIGNRNIIQQLLEIHADPSLPNNKGVSAKDFGIGVEPGEQPYVNGGLASQQSIQTLPAPQDLAFAEGDAEGGGSESQVEDLSQDIVESMASMLTQNLASHKELLRVRTEQIDRINEQIREFSALQKTDLEQLQELKERVRSRAARQEKIANLKHAIAERRASRSAAANNKKRPAADSETSWLDSATTRGILGEPSPTSSSSEPLTPAQRHFLTTSTNLPAPATLRAQLAAYTTHNSLLRSQALELASRSSAIEDLYRKVVSLCTGVEEGRVAGLLPGLVAAVESEGGKGGYGGAGGGMGMSGLSEMEAGRAREFLRRVEGMGGVGVGEGS